MRADRVFELIAASDPYRLAGVLAEDPELVNVGVNGVTPLEAACGVVTCDQAIPARDGGEAAHRLVDELLLAGAIPSVPTSDGTTPVAHRSIQRQRATRDPTP